jgi:hypothetical protein
LNPEGLEGPWAEIELNPKGLEGPWAEIELNPEGLEGPWAEIELNPEGHGPEPPIQFFRILARRRPLWIKLNWPPGQ